MVDVAANNDEVNSPIIPPSSDARGQATAMVDFGPEAPIAKCSTSKCSAGHVWTPVIQMAKCPGCDAPMLVVKMVNCPMCNEPVRSTTLRVEHCPHGGQITAVCLGHASLNEVLAVEFTHEHAQQEQDKHVVREMISKV